MLAGFHKDLLGVVVGPGKGDVLGLEEISALGRIATVVGTSKDCDGVAGQSDGSPYVNVWQRLAY
jgi:hypothetical protein